MKNWQIFDRLNQENGVIAGSTTKDNSFGYNFSLATHTGEELQKILKNRDFFAKNFPSNFGFISFVQIHSDIVKDISNYEKFEGWYQNIIEADGMVTNKKGVVLTILTADCLALLAYDSINRVIGAAHAGWRGVKQNIAKNLINKMELLGAKRENIIFALSPSIKGCCYEVGEEVAKNFFDFPNSLKKIDGKYMLDISIAQKEQLLRLGIKENNINVSPICTSCSNDIYFSYRKECGCSGRFLNFIAME